MKQKLGGYFKIVAHKLDGSSRVLADWFPNLILDAGMNKLGGLNAIGATNYCHVGSGSAAPLVTDTQLQNFVASASQISGATSGYSGSPPYYGWWRGPYQFAVGAAAGTLAEIGVGSSHLNGNLFSRALILDAEGNPTTITVLPDEILEVNYELRLYPPTVDFEGTFSMAGVEYSYVARPFSVTSSAWSPSGMGLWGFFYNNSITISVYGVGAVMSAITGNGLSGYTGQSNGGTGVADPVYTNNVFKRKVTHNFSLSQGNIASGIRGIEIRANALGNWQFLISPAIPKDNSKVMTFPVTWSWDRYVA